MVVKLNVEVKSLNEWAVMARRISPNNVGDIQSALIVYSLIHLTNLMARGGADVFFFFKLSD